MREPLTSRTRARSRPLGLVARAALVAGVLAAAVAPAMLSRMPARAAVSQPLAQEYDQELFGNFKILGNSVTQCPDGNATCAAVASRTDPGNNDQFAMRYADVDNDPATFDSSSATLTVPAGARIDFAHLYWAGNTGLGTASDGTVRKPSCMGTSSAPTTLPPGSPATQKVSVAFGGQPRTDLAGKVFVEDAPPPGQAQYYSGEADIKALLAAQPTGEPVTVTVGNVWTPAGPGCFGGWSIIYVYKFDGPTSVEPFKHEVFVHAGHIKEGSTDPAINLELSGFSVLGNVAPKIGMTAYEGDYGIKGDTFAINGSNIAEPSTGATDNFFISAADDEAEPHNLNNLSVDAKTFGAPKGLIPAGSTSVKLTFATKGDRYLVQNLAFSVGIPELRIAKVADPPVAAVGSTVTFTITVSNPTDEDATDVAVTDPTTPACGKTIGALAAGASVKYTCTATVTANQNGLFRNAASVAGTVAGATANGSVTTDVAIPSLKVTVTPDKTEAALGDTVTYTVTVTNDGTADLDNVTVSDSVLAGCGKTIGALAAGASTTYTCSGPAGRDSATAATFTNQVQVSGNPVVPPGASPASPVKAEAAVPVQLLLPAITITKTPVPAHPGAGDPVAFIITVTNTGRVPLTDVAVSDPSVPACSRTVGSLAPGASSTCGCMISAAPDAPFSNTATATGTPPTGPEVSDTATVDVNVALPAIRRHA